MRLSLTAPLAAAALAAAAIAAPAAMAGTSGASCSTSGYSYGASMDAMSFNWSLRSSLLRTGTARLQVAPSGASVYSTISAVSVRRSGSGTLYGSVASPSYLPAGRYAWRVEVTEWDGTAFTCDGSSPFEVTRLPAPSVSLSGSGITPDGWRVVSSGQYVGVAPGSGDLAGGTGLVRFQYASGAWSSYRSAPAQIPSTDIAAVQAVRQSDTYMSGSAVTLPLRTDSSAPATPRPRANSVDVGPSGADVGFSPSSDAGSGTATYEALVITQAGAKGSWQRVSGFAARASAGSGGGTMLLKACDRVGNCSAPSEIALVAR
ncbi:MAG: hypothetical protein ACO3PB_08605, partial [Miltoncostaeaceae bacterium]